MILNHLTSHKLHHALTHITMVISQPWWFWCSIWRKLRVPCGVRYVAWGFLTVMGVYPSSYTTWSSCVLCCRFYRNIYIVLIFTQHGIYYLLVHASCTISCRIFIFLFWNSYLSSLLWWVYMLDFDIRRSECVIAWNKMVFVMPLFSVCGTVHNCSIPLLKTKSKYPGIVVEVRSWPLGEQNAQ